MPISFITKKEIKKGEAFQGKDMREGIFNLISQTYPEFSPESYLSLEEINLFRRKYMTHLLVSEKGEMEKLDQEVLEAIEGNSILSENIREDINLTTTFGDRIADKIASFGGSWTFILSFFGFLVIWMTVNVIFLSQKPFDPYPFILLNLILSCLAAIQAPIIMMSQNRQEAKDRQREENDYKINLKAELEIKLLSEKIDYLIIHQNKKILEIQEVQIDYLEGLIQKSNAKKKE